MKTLVKPVSKKTATLRKKKNKKTKKISSGNKALDDAIKSLFKPNKDI
ncbi:hypothetical protein [Pedobacter alluvionis]|jgi:hypothetical protein|uniref:Uncharacterized protein n=1 Tax=Pedobacter alluvionis TaxID=475253 RepID=A0A497XL01_9SPHI|nr:hypothetical protein [Pedobacter alluvionis]RLJ69316.1 hypothetical protein BCL90_5238 [Pedobacter alluvionis]